MKQTDWNEMYINARQEWAERYGDYVNSANIWRFIAISALLITLISVGGIVYIGSQQKIIPYIVEVDKLGRAMPVSRADLAQPIDTRIIRSTVARWINNTRSVYLDAGAERALIKEAYALTNKNSPAYNKLNEHFRQPKNDPFKRAETETVSVDVQSVLPLSADTWRIEWVEVKRDRKGELISTIPMQATTTINISSPLDEENILTNPLGIFVSDFAWSQRM